MDTPEARYDQLTDRVGTLYDEGLQRVALDLLDAADPGLEPWSAELAHLRACLLGSLGESTEALATLQQASDAGGWWEEGILTEDDDLAALQYLPAFQRLVELSRSRRVTSQDQPLIRLPSGDADSVTRPRGVVVALHGAGQRASHAMRDWSGVLEAGYALVGVESSQLMSPMYRTWPDPVEAVKDISRALEQLPAELRGLPLIAAGFSAGGRVALNWAVEADPVPADGVVVLAPALREVPEKAQGPLSPATVLIGTEDELLEVVEAAEEQLAALGLTVERLPRLGHEFPPDFAPQLWITR
ncbi:alpha/beta hydrolase [Streptomyces sp. SID13031]|uniref:serine aminopeptidase domain-containing protein n=1 Tax=Streptomyces sp. SID13031 TaxID=2706046 RepID=UPI0013C87D94|nr:alpha/beta hydrolase [Streptomyces sp. SID13031]